MSLKDKLKEDQLFQKSMKRILKMEMKDEQWADEISSLHVRRDIRALNSKELLQSAQRRTIDSNLDNQAVRSRCVEIQMTALKQKITFEEIVVDLRKYLTAKYGGYLKKNYGSAPERRAVIENALAKAVRMLNRLDHVIKLAGLVIEDADAAGFTYKRIGDVLAIKARDK
jgi:hypothetical protein